MLMIQLRRRVRGRSFRPMQALVSPFSTLGMHSLMQFLALPQKPFAKRRYFCLLKPAIFNIQQLMEEQGPYEIPLEPILAEIDKQNWAELASACTKFPQNQFFTVSPPHEYLIYYRYFRSILEREQVSYRSYLLTTLILKLKSSNYYALMVRCQWMMKQPYDEGDLIRELFFINCLLNSNGKEYQLWTYKKRLIQHFKANLTNADAIYTNEDDFLEYLLEEDSKNYHVWDYKLWLTLEFGREEQQIARCSTLLFEDYISPQLLQQLREQNLSISKIEWTNCYPLWSYRHNLIVIHRKKTSQNDRQNEEREELSKIQNWIGKKENHLNECGWNYLTGIVLEYSVSSQQIIGRVADQALQIYRQNRKNRFAGGAFLILCKELALRFNQVRSQKEEVLNSLLATDKTRQSYYKYLLAQ